MINFSAMTHEQIADAICSDIAKNPIHDGSLRDAILVALEVVRDRATMVASESDQETRKQALAIYMQEDRGAPAHPGQWKRLREIEAYLWLGKTPAEPQMKFGTDCRTHI